MTLDKKEAIEGGSVTVNCSVPEEKAPIHFLVEKIDHNTKTVKQRKEKTNWNQNFMTLEFPIEERERLLVFQCQVSISITSGSHKEISEFTRSDLVTVRGQALVPLLIILCGCSLGVGTEKGQGLLAGAAISNHFKSIFFLAF